jgi:hypothetical protein
VARFTPKRVEKILADPGIVRNRLKVEGAVKNASAFLALQEEANRPRAGASRLRAGGKTCTTPNATCCMSLALERGTICSSQVSPQH